MKKIWKVCCMYRVKDQVNRKWYAFIIARKQKQNVKLLKVNFEMFGYLRSKFGLNIK